MFLALSDQLFLLTWPDFIPPTTICCSPGFLPKNVGPISKRDKTWKTIKLTCETNNSWSYTFRNKLSSSADIEKVNKTQHISEQSNSQKTQAVFVLKHQKQKGDRVEKDDLVLTQKQPFGLMLRLQTFPAWLTQLIISPSVYFGLLEGATNYPVVIERQSHPSTRYIYIYISYIYV